MSTYGLYVQVITALVYVLYFRMFDCYGYLEGINLCVQLCVSYSYFYEPRGVVPGLSLEPDFCLGEMYSEGHQASTSSSAISKRYCKQV